MNSSKTPPDTAQAAERELAVHHLSAAVLQVVRRMRSFEASGTGCGLSRTQIAVLGTLAQSGPMRLTTLSSVLHQEMTSLSRQVAAMDEAGMVERVRDETDRRAWTVHLTDHGAETLDRIQDGRKRWFDKTLGEFSAQQIADTAAVLNALSEATAKATSGAAASNQ
jgi:DNA-binding MarR family transcriptional regulator